MEEERLSMYPVIRMMKLCSTVSVALHMPYLVGCVAQWWNAGLQPANYP